MGTWNIDETQWPMVVVTLDGKFDDAQMDAFFESFTELFRRGRKFSVVVDASSFKEPSVKHRSQMRNFMVENREYTRRNCLGVAYVVVAPVLRMFLKAVFLLQKPTAVTKVTRSIEDARNWAKERAGF